MSTTTIITPTLAGVISEQRAGSSSELARAAASFRVATTEHRRAGQIADELLKQLDRAREREMVAGRKADAAGAELERLALLP